MKGSGRGIYALLAIGVLLPGGGLALFGYRSLVQDRLLDERRLRDMLTGAAESAAQDIEAELESWREWDDPGIARVDLRRRTATGVLWQLDSPGGVVSDCAAEGWALEAERLEIRNGNPQAASALYEKAALASGKRCRAEHWLRVARTREKSGDRAGALAAWRSALQEPPSAAGAAAELAMVEAGALDPHQMLADLGNGRFPVGREMFHFYLQQLVPRLPQRKAPEALQRRVELSEAVMSFLSKPERTPGAGLTALWDEETAIVIPDAAFLARLENRAGRRGAIRIAARPAGSPRGEGCVSIPLRDRSLPLRIEATLADVQAFQNSLRQKEMFFLLAVGLVLAVSLLGFLLMTRAVRREIHAARMQADFVSTVSHEFRSPLTGVRQLAELLDSGLVSSEDRKKEYYRLILQESGRLTRLVENLLDFSRLEAGRKQYNMTRLDTTAWLDEVAGAVRDPRLVVDLDPCLPPILGDRDALSSAVANLIDNALKYSPRESPVSLTAAASGGDIRVSVADAGPGIPASERARIFDKFYRGQGDPAERVKGAGIGLSLVRRIVEDHGGTVTLESREGEGSVFTLQLKTESAP